MNITITVTGLKLIIWHFGAMFFSKSFHLSLLQLLVCDTRDHRDLVMIKFINNHKMLRYMAND